MINDIKACYVNSYKLVIFIISSAKK